LSPKWTGPYRAVEVPGNGAYRLETLEGDLVLEHGMLPTSSFIVVNLNYIIEQCSAIRWCSFSLKEGFLKRPYNKSRL